MKYNSFVSRHINCSAVIQSCMQHRYGIVFCHVDFIKDPKTSGFCTLDNRTFPQLDFVVAERIRTDQCTAVCIDMKRNIISWPSKKPGKIFCKNIFPGGLSAAEQHVFAR